MGKFSGRGGKTSFPAATASAIVTFANVAAALAAATASIDFNCQALEQIDHIEFDCGGAIATTGLIRAPNNVTLSAAMNAAGTQNLTVSATNGSNHVLIGDTSNVVRTVLRATTAVQVGMALPAFEVGSGSTATVGFVRLQTLGGTSRDLIVTRNAGDTGNIPIASLDTGGILYYNRALEASVTPAATCILNASSTLQLHINNTLQLSMTSTTVSIAPGGTTRITTTAATTSIQPTTTINLIINGNNRVTVVDATVTINPTTTVLIQSGSTTRIETNGTGIGFFTKAPVAKPSITGSRGGNAALASLLTGLGDGTGLGLITDNTTA